MVNTDSVIVVIIYCGTKKDKCNLNLEKLEILEAQMKKEEEFVVVHIALVAVFILFSRSPLVHKLAPHIQWARRDLRNKQASHSRLVGGRFSKQRNLHMRLVLGGHKNE